MSSPISHSTFASISLNSTDKVRLHQFPPSIRQPIAKQIRDSWPPGIQAEHVYAKHAYEYKLRGTPFGTGRMGLGSRRLIRDVLAYLYARGWVLVTPLSHRRHAGSKDSLVFRQRRVEGAMGVVEKGLGPEGCEVVIPPPVEWLVIAPTGGDRLKVISDGPLRRDVVSKSSLTGHGELGVVGNNEEAPSASAPRSRECNHEELEVLVQSLKQVLTGLDYFQSGKWGNGQISFEFKVKGYPWLAQGKETVMVERLILAVVETLDRFGWRSYATVRQGGYSEENQDTWYFVREEGWVPGSPFNAEPSSVGIDFQTWP
jgi:hypothetical protein